MIELTAADLDRMERRDGPVHAAFGLSYCSYLVLPRVLMQEMSLDWQERFVALIDEYWQEWDCMKADRVYTVTPRDKHGRFEKDPLCNYRHPKWQLIESMRNQEP